jgi:type I site-specific restriction-modification system R (restriction) subunit
MHMNELTPPTKQEIEDWLTTLGRDRHWLAQQLNVSPDTVKGWLSAGRSISGAAVPLLWQLMRKPVAEINPSFTMDEWERIEKTAAKVGMKAREWITYILKKALSEDALEDTAKSQPQSVNMGPTNILPIAAETPERLLDLPAPKSLGYVSTRRRRLH